MNDRSGFVIRAGASLVLVILALIVILPSFSFIVGFEFDYVVVVALAGFCVLLLQRYSLNGIRRPWIWFFGVVVFLLMTLMWLFAFLRFENSVYYSFFYVVHFAIGAGSLWVLRKQTLIAWKRLTDLVEHVGSFFKRGLELNDNQRRRIFIVTVGLLFVFLGVQIYQMFFSPIGTDEGNAINTFRLLVLENASLYSDLWAREPGAVVAFLPLFHALPISLMYLRLVVLVLHILVVGISMKVVKDFFSPVFLPFVPLIALLLTYTVFDFYTGFFYQVWRFSLVLATYFIIRYVSQKSLGLFVLGALALLSGFSILVYKGSVLFLIIFPLVLYVTHNRNIMKAVKRSLFFLLISSLPILAFFSYYSYRTDPYHIFHIIIGEILVLFGLLLLVTLLLFLLNLSNPINRVLSWCFTPERVLFSLHLFLFIVFTGIALLNPKGIALMYWVGVVVGAFYFFVPLLALSILLLTRVQRRIVFVGHALFIALFVLLGFGTIGFFNFISDAHHWSLAIIVFLTMVWLGRIAFSRLEKPANAGRVYSTVAIVGSFLFLGAFIGGSFSSMSPGRVTIFTSFFIVLFITVVVYMAQRLRSIHGGVHVLIVFVFLLLSNTLYLHENNDLTIYGLNAYYSAVDYISTKAGDDDFIFTGDTAIAAAVPNVNLIALSSPWIYRDVPELFYIYDGIEDEYSGDLVLSKQGIAEKMQLKKPEYILGSSRLTFRTFFDASDPLAGNVPLREILDNQYILIKRFGSILVYQRL